MSADASRLIELRNKFTQAAYDYPELNGVVTWQLPNPKRFFDPQKGAPITRAEWAIRYLHDNPNAKPSTMENTEAIRQITHLAPGQKWLIDPPIMETRRVYPGADLDWIWAIYPSGDEIQKSEPLLKGLAKTTLSLASIPSRPQFNPIASWLIFLADRDDPLEAESLRRTWHCGWFPYRPGDNKARRMTKKEAETFGKRVGLKWNQTLPNWWAVHLENVFRLSAMAIEKLLPPDTAKREGNDLNEADLYAYHDERRPEGQLLTANYCKTRYNLTGKDLSTNERAKHNRKHNPSGRGYVYRYEVIRDMSDAKHPED